MENNASPKASPEGTGVSQETVSQCLTKISTCYSVSSRAAGSAAAFAFFSVSQMCSRSGTWLVLPSRAPLGSDSAARPRPQLELLTNTSKERVCDALTPHTAPCLHSAQEERSPSERREEIHIAPVCPETQFKVQHVLTIKTTGKKPLCGRAIIYQRWL